MTLRQAYRPSTLSTSKAGSVVYFVTLTRFRYHAQNVRITKKLQQYWREQIADVDKLDTLALAVKTLLDR